MSGYSDESALQAVLGRRCWLTTAQVLTPLAQSPISSGGGSPHHSPPSSPPQLRPMTQQYSCEDLLAATAALDSETSTIRFLAATIPSLDLYLNKGREVRDSLIQSIQRSIVYRCAYCHRRVLTSIVRCCAVRDSNRAAARRLITIVSFGVRSQIEEILICNIKAIAEVHKRIHDDGLCDINRDFHDSHTFRTFVESESEFNRKEMTIQLVLNLDGFPCSKRYSITPVLMQIADLPSNIRGLMQNIVVMGVFGARAKIPLDIWDDHLTTMKRSIEGRDFECDGWRIKATVMYGAVDAEMERFLSPFGWNGSYGCFTCVHPGERIGNSNKFPYDSNTIHRLRGLRETRIHAQQAQFGFKQGMSFMHNIVPIQRCLYDGLHILDEGIITDLIKGASTPACPIYIGPIAMSEVNRIQIRTCARWVNPRPLFDSKMTGSEKSIHAETSLILLCMKDEYGIDASRFSPLIFGLCIFVKMLRTREYGNQFIYDMKQVASRIQEEYMNTGLRNFFSFKFHTALVHCPDRMISLCAVDDFSLTSFEGINKVLLHGRNPSATRGLEVRQATRHMCRMTILRKLDVQSSGEERERASLLYSSLRIDDGMSIGPFILKDPSKRSSNMFRSLRVDNVHYTVGDYAITKTQVIGRIETVTLMPNSSVILRLITYHSESLFDFISSMHSNNAFLTDLSPFSRDFSDRNFFVSSLTQNVVAVEITPSDLLHLVTRTHCLGFSHALFTVKNDRFRYE